MLHKLLTLTAVVCATLTLSAQELFYTDFLTTPPDIAAASKKATNSTGGYDTLAQCLPGGAAPVDSVIDGITFSSKNSSTSHTMILLSKGTQTCVAYGDVLGCTPGRLSIKNSGSYVQLPSVEGPCKLTYYAASSSKTSPGRGFMVYVNEIMVDEAGITDLWKDDKQATVKIEYSHTEAGPVVFKLVAIGGVYLYDIKIEAGGTSVNRKTFGVHYPARTVWTEDNLVINSNKNTINFYSIAGKVVLQSAQPAINIATLPAGIYMAQVLGTNESIKIIR